jgi:hypothetical protein
MLQQKEFLAKHWDLLRSECETYSETLGHRDTPAPATALGQFAPSLLARS